MLNSHTARTVVLSLIILVAWVLAGCQAPAQQPPAAPQTPASSPPPPASNPDATQQPAAAPAVNAVAWAADGEITPGEYPNNKSFGDYELNWSSDAQYVYVGMKAKTTGWVAVGFDPESMMKNADIIQGYVQDGKLSIADMFSSNQFGLHPPDTQQGGTDDILASGGKSDNGYTTVEFKRKLDTGDKFDKPLHKGTNKIIWAYGSDPVFTIKHTARGSGEIDLQ